MEKPLNTKTPLKKTIMDTLEKQTLWGKFEAIEAQLNELRTEINPDAKNEFEPLDKFVEIPKDIWGAIHLDAYARLLLMLIHQHGNNELTIISESTYKGMALFCSCSVSTVKRRISMLVEMGHLKETTTPEGLYTYSYVLKN